MNLSMLWLIQTGSVNLPAEELAMVKKTAMVWTLGGLLPMANLAGAISLFLLRKIAVYIFSGMFAAGLINGIIQLILLDWSFQTISSQSLAQVVVGYAITLAVCIYAFRLKEQNVLT